MIGTLSLINFGCERYFNLCTHAKTGLIFSIANGSIIISEDAKKESREVINDLIKAAYNNAKENLKKKSSEELSNLTGGIQLPFDIKPPF